MKNLKKGAVLGTVLVILLMMGLLATALMKMPGSVKRSIPHHEKKMNEIYRGESAIIAYMEQFPEGFFNGKNWNMNLPEVIVNDDLLWRELSANVPPYGKIKTYAGVPYRRLGYEELANFSKDFLADLKGHIYNSDSIKKMSGSRRFTGNAKNLNVWIEGGDLLMDLDGRGKIMNLGCDGNAVIKGTFHVDTLRLYAAGDVSLSGSVEISHLEIFGGGRVEISRNFKFSGLLLAKNDVVIKDQVALRFPGVIASANGDLQFPSSMEKSVCVDSSFGKVSVISARVQSSQNENRHNPIGSADCLLPASLGGKLQAFRWSLE